MPADDYTAAVSGGLKLKSANPSSKISKSHKKKRPKPSQPADASADKSKNGTADDGEDIKDERDDAVIDKSEQAVDEGAAIMSPPRAGKTEAELRHEEHRRKRVCLFPQFALYLTVFTGNLADVDCLAG